jgi:hypothetical protein
VMKGQNCLTEMYSAIKAEYEIESDPRTKTNIELMSKLTSGRVSFKKSDYFILLSDTHHD